jgi:hypothetical protein
MKKIEKKLTSKCLSTFWKKFSTSTYYKNIFYGVFELPLLRNAQKRTNKSRLVGGWVGLRFSKCRGGLSISFLGGPSQRGGNESDVYFANSGLNEVSRLVLFWGVNSSRFLLVRFLARGVPKHPSKQIPKS